MSIKLEIEVAQLRAKTVELEARLHALETRAPSYEGNWDHDGVEFKPMKRGPGRPRKEAAPD